MNECTDDYYESSLVLIVQQMQLEILLHGIGLQLLTAIQADMMTYH